MFLVGEALIGEEPELAHIDFDHWRENRTRWTGICERVYAAFDGAHPSSLGHKTEPPC